MHKTRHAVTAILATTLLIFIEGDAAFASGFCSKSQFVLDNRCMLFKKSGATTYTRRDVASPKMFSTQYGGPFLGYDVDELNDMPAGWVRETGVLDSKTGGKSEQFVGWIPVSDLVDSNSLRTVSDCWPIKSISYSAGDFAVDLRSDMDGTYYQNTPAETSPRRPLGKVMFAGDIVAYVTPYTPQLARVTGLPYNAQANDVFFAGFDPATLDIFPDGYVPDDLKVEYHSPQALEGCQHILVKGKRGGN